MKMTDVDISNIIKNFGKEKRIFQREAQFQFELAWKLQEEIGKDGKVLLEVCSCTRRATEGKKTKRFYSDIILKDNDGFIVIELKYKTKAEDKSVYGVCLTGQGAQDEGRYDYLWDIRRIELLKNRNDSKYEYANLGKFLGGYAIMLTNDNQYWEKTKESAENDNKQTVDLQFRIGENDEVSGTVDWNTEKRKDWMNSRPAITFDDCYEFNWNSYYCAVDNSNKRKNKEFKYLITHIK